MKTNNFSRYFKKIDREIILILIFALILRIVFFVGMEFFDDGLYLYYGHKISQGEFVYPTWTWSARIGVYFPIALSFLLFGVSEFSGSLYFLLASLGSIVVTYYLAKEFLNKKAAIISAFLLSFFPLDVITTIGPDIPVQFYMALTILLFVIARKVEPKNKRKAIILYFLSGAACFVAYITKEIGLLVVPLLLILVLISKRKISKNYIYFGIGFLLSLFLENLYFYLNTGKWFLAENVRAYALANDKNTNLSYWFYPITMLNLQKPIFGFIEENILPSFGLPPLFSWINDTIPAFGLFYYFIIPSIFYVLIKRLKKAYFFVIWAVGLFLFLEFFNQWICTTITQCLVDKHIRYMTIISIPSVIVLGYALTFLRSRYLILILLLLLITSLWYIHVSTKFLRNGMGLVREQAYFLKTLPEKTIYVPDHWHLVRLSFFLGYKNESLIKPYDCSWINCSDEFYNSGKFISDAYVIDANQYTYINPNTYPDFIRKVPSNWILLKTIEIENRGIFEKIKPRIYYAPGK